MMNKSFQGKKVMLYLLAKYSTFRVKNNSFRLNQTTKQIAAMGESHYIFHTLGFK